MYSFYAQEDLKLVTVARRGEKHRPMLIRYVEEQMQEMQEMQEMQKILLSRIQVGTCGAAIDELQGSGAENEL